MLGGNIWSAISRKIRIKTKQYEKGWATAGGAAVENLDSGPAMKKSIELSAFPPYLAHLHNALKKEHFPIAHVQAPCACTQFLKFLVHLAILSFKVVVIRYLVHEFEAWFMLVIPV